ncbi:MAG: UDP-N-acetylglucosamine 2-epimerase (non-hydrolyzing) [Actinomycetia bacterium]|nr:UDP-N-acetylglucosamine 2-epimerase (non-hydrolyzing) [Actinomycetes bacterium]
MQDSLVNLPHRSIAVVLGTRPEIIKLAGIVRALGDAAVVIHTGQHYDASLSDVFFEQFGMRPPDHHIAIGGSTRGNQIGTAVSELDALFREIDPLGVVVQGDTNTVVAGALAANANEIPIAHVEAGLRSFDRAMPEEHNRVVADHLADVCLAPTEVSVANLTAENIPDERVVLTGNTIVEAVERLMPSSDERRAIIAEAGVTRGAYVLATFHRPENVDDSDNLEKILTELAELSVPTVLPMHPRTVARVTEFGLESLLAEITSVDPIGYREFLSLGAESSLVVSDSGGVQEEVSIYKRPLIVVRNSTERPEVLGTFAELVEPGPGIRTIAESWLEDIEAVHTRLAGLPSPYGDATSVNRSVEAIEGHLHA